MNRQTTLSLFAAAVFAVVMAASSASGQQVPDPEPNTPERNQYCWDVRVRCVMDCFNNSNTPEDRAACEGRCNAQIPPDCVQTQTVRQPLGAARLSTSQRPVLRRQ